MTNDAQTRFSFPAAMVIGALLIMFAVLSYSAALTKCPTVDEPIHLTASYICQFLGDYRSNPEHPVLWKYWATIFLNRNDIHIDNTSGMVPDSSNGWSPAPWPSMLAELRATRAQADCANDSLYGQRTTRTEAAFAAGRAAMLILGVLLGLFISLWAWRLGGVAAAIIAALLFSFDPNMLAHAALVTNDIAFTLCFALMAWAAWLAGRRLSIPRAVLLALTCAVAINVKYSALICGPIVALLLIIRIFLPVPWPATGKIILRNWFSRLVAAILLGLVCITASILLTWAVYGFRFGPSNNPGEMFNTPELLRIIRHRDHQIPFGQDPLQLEQLPLRVRAIWWIEEHRLLPQGYTYGLLRFERDAVNRRSFLCGDIRNTGWWYYYPAAILFKTPLAMLFLAGLAMTALGLRRRRIQHGEEQKSEDRSPKSAAENVAPSSPCHQVTLSPCHPLWTLLCLLLPPAAYLAVGMGSAFNIGIRHIFPIYPFLFIGVALSLAWLWRQRWRTARVVMIVLFAGLAAETLAGYPHYIAFFNQACGGWRGGGKYLADSNLDWGQDLPLLADWQIKHPDTPLYLCYFGHADPEFYRVNYIAMTGGYLWPGQNVRRISLYDPPPTEPGWLALSANVATMALLFSAEEREYYARLVNLDKPDEILGGSIYLYRYPRRK